jgi:LysM repeat protein
MFPSCLTSPGVALLAALLVGLMLGAARTSSGAFPGAVYTVRSGDTLWSIAARHYAGDIREAVWRIERRNRLDGGLIVPGEVIVLP